MADRPRPCPALRQRAPCEDSVSAWPRPPDPPRMSEKAGCTDTQVRDGEGLGHRLGPGPGHRSSESQKARLLPEARSPRRPVLASAGPKAGCRTAPEASGGGSRSWDLENVVTNSLGVSGFPQTDGRHRLERGWQLRGPEPWTLSWLWAAPGDRVFMAS